ncbi:MAG: single-stranded DNA-binding protein [Blastochloris sp.]|nr:single-stranded DNA-binding protein [Blastochloris sp.]
MNPRISPKETLELLLGHLGQVFEIREEERPMGPTLHILTREPGRLTGRGGKTLDDLQYLLNRIIHQGEDDDTPRILIDVENFRQQEFDRMMQQVDEVARQVMETGKEAELPPMNSFERRLVHNHFQGHPKIQSVSPKSEDRIKSILLRLR